MLVVGCILLLGAALFLILSIQAIEPQKEKLIEFSGLFGAAGAPFVILRFALFSLPDILKRRRSPSLQKRRKIEAERSARHAGKTPTPARQTQSGSVLILVLILAGLVAALLLQSNALARARAAASQASQEHTRLRQAATEAVRNALQRLANDDDLTVDTTNDTWAIQREEHTPLGIATQVSIRDEQARFDLNNLAIPPAPGRRSGEDIAMDLLTLCGNFSPAAQVGALRDFVDEDGGGAHEADFYRRLTPPSACPNRVLYGWSEIRSVDGWSEEQLARRPRTSSLDGFNASLVDHVTLIPVARIRPLPLNVNTASREALRAVVGLEQDNLVETALTLRALRPIRQLDVFSVTAGPETFDRIQPYLDVRSHYFRIHARAGQNGREVGIEALVHRQDDGRVLVLQWVEEPS